MLEILALYVFMKCYGLFDSGAYSSWSRFQAQIASRSSEECVAEFRREVERVKTSPTARRWYTSWRATTSRFDEQRLRQAAALTSEQLDAVLALARENLRKAVAAGR